MKAPTPAAVRCALAQDGDVVTPGELLASVADKRPESQVLRDHIRAIAQEMRGQQDQWPNWDAQDVWSLFKELADKLEGKQNENT